MNVFDLMAYARLLINWESFAWRHDWDDYKRDFGLDKFNNDVVQSVRLWNLGDIWWFVSIKLFMQNLENPTWQFRESINFTFFTNLQKGLIISISERNVQGKIQKAKFNSQRYIFNIHWVQRYKNPAPALFSKSRIFSTHHFQNPHTLTSMHFTIVQSWHRMMPNTKCNFSFQVTPPQGNKIHSKVLLTGQCFSKPWWGSFVEKTSSPNQTIHGIWK